MVKYTVIHTKKGRDLFSFFKSKREADIFVLGLKQGGIRKITVKRTLKQ